MTATETIHQHANVVRLDLRLYLGRCSCGWDGPDRETRAEAEADCVEHRRQS